MRPGLESVFQTAERRIFFSTFSSHVHRIQQVLDLSATSDRRVAVVGRSLLNGIRIATDLGQSIIARHMGDMNARPNFQTGHGIDLGAS